MSLGSCRTGRTRRTGSSRRSLWSWCAAVPFGPLNSLQPLWTLITLVAFGSLNSLRTLRACVAGITLVPLLSLKPLNSLRTLITLITFWSLRPNDSWFSICSLKSLRTRRTCFTLGPRRARIGSGVRHTGMCGRETERNGCEGDSWREYGAVEYDPERINTVKPQLIRERPEECAEQSVADRKGDLLARPNILRAVEKCKDERGLSIERLSVRSHNALIGDDAGNLGCHRKDKCIKSILRECGEGSEEERPVELPLEGLLSQLGFYTIN